jgi:hypothetical protein
MLLLPLCLVAPPDAMLAPGRQPAGGRSLGPSSQRPLAAGPLLLQELVQSEMARVYGGRHLVSVQVGRQAAATGHRL